VESAGLLGFARRLDTQNEDFYLRLRAGDTRKRAEVIASGIEYGGDPASLVREIWDRIDAYDDPECPKVWVEAIRNKTSTVLDVACISLPETPQDLVAVSGEARAIEALTSAVLSLAHDAAESNRIANERFLSMVTVLMESKIAETESRMLVEANYAGQKGADMSQAIEVFGGLVPAVAGLLLAKAEAAKAKEPEPVVAPPKKPARRASAKKKKKSAGLSTPSIDATL